MFGTERSIADGMQGYLFRYYATHIVPDLLYVVFYDGSIKMSFILVNMIDKT